MELVAIYQSFSDPIRLRILHLVRVGGPLCVCHFQEILEQPQVRISKHLAYLKSKGLLEAKRYQNWMIYALPQRLGVELEANLDCLELCAKKQSIFKDDLRRLARLRPKVDELTAVACCAPLTTCKPSKR